MAAVYTQRLAKEEGMFLGNSAGAADQRGASAESHTSSPMMWWWCYFMTMAARYVGKMFNDDWMREMGYIN